MERSINGSTGEDAEYEDLQKWKNYCEIALSWKDRSARQNIVNGKTHI